jgi:hypothetical protein
LAALQLNLEQQQKQLEADRQRAKTFRRRLHQHYQRRLAAERQRLISREAAIADERRRIQKEAENLHHQRDDLWRAQLRFNADFELSNRQLEAAWLELRQAQNLSNEDNSRKQQELAARAQVLQQRAEALTDTERNLNKAKRDWELQCKVAEQEVQGLERRIINQRRKFFELNPNTSDVRTPVSDVKQADSNLRHDANESGPEDLATVDLHRLADDLADQRLELAEHWQRLALTKEEWEQTRRSAAAMLQEIASDLPRTEQLLHCRETELQRGREELARFRQHLEAWAGRIRVRENAFQTERERLLADVQARESVAERHLVLLADLRQRWAARRAQELELLQSQRAACEQLRQEYAQLRQECWKRALSLEQQHREVSEKLAALVEYQQQLILRSQNPAAVEARLVRIRNRWLRHNAALVQNTKEEFERLQHKAAHLNHCGKELASAAEELTKREATFAERQSAWDELQARRQTRQIAIRQQLETAEAQERCSQQQIAELRAEIEQLAKALLDTCHVPESLPARAA